MLKRGSTRVGTGECTINSSIVHTCLFKRSFPLLVSYADPYGVLLCVDWEDDQKNILLKLARNEKSLLQLDLSRSKLKDKDAEQVSNNTVHNCSSLAMSDTGV